MQASIDVLVIGAGPAGTIAASILNQNGLKTKIVESCQFPRFVIGESLLPRCMENLAAANFLDALNQQGFQKKFGAKFHRGKQESDFNFSDRVGSGWNWTWQVPRADFDNVLAEEVQRQGVPVEFNATVKDVEFSGQASTTYYVNALGERCSVESRFIIDASGYGRVLPTLLDLNSPSNFPKRETLFTHFFDRKRPQGLQEQRITVVVVKPDVWAWVIPFSNGRTSIGFVGNPDFFKEFNGSLEERLRAMVALDENVERRVGNAEFCFEPRSIQNYAVSTKKMYGDGFVCAGNATEFLDPVFSSGVTFATESGALAARLVSRQLQGQAVDWDRDYVDHMNQGINTFRTFVSAWYDGTLQDIIFGSATAGIEKQQICAVLAGYVWDMDNPINRQHQRILPVLAKLVRSRSKPMERDLGISQ